jgi:hypothetical protein
MPIEKSYTNRIVSVPFCHSLAELLAWFFRRRLDLWQSVDAAQSRNDDVEKHRAERWKLVCSRKTVARLRWLLVDQIYLSIN